MYDLHGTQQNFLGGLIKAGIGLISGGGIGSTALDLVGGGGGGGRGGFVEGRKCVRDSRGNLVVRGTGGRQICPGSQRINGGTQEAIPLPDIDPTRMSPAERSLAGGGGTAVMGRFGAALLPDVDRQVVHHCLPGMVLGRDNLCYNRRDIRNSDRMWPRGRRPLGTPGELAALAKAARFGRRMETTVKRMQKIGVLKKPASRKACPKPKMLASGEGVRVVNVE